MLENGKLKLIHNFMQLPNYLILIGRKDGEILYLQFIDDTLWVTLLCWFIHSSPSHLIVSNIILKQCEKIFWHNWSKKYFSWVSHEHQSSSPGQQQHHQNKNQEYHSRCLRTVLIKRRIRSKNYLRSLRRRRQWWWELELRKSLIQRWTRMIK